MRLADAPRTGLSDLGRQRAEAGAWREALARTIEAHDIDVVIAGPVVRLGMDEAGTMQEIRDFMGLVDEVRECSGRRAAVVLIHTRAARSRAPGRAPATRSSM
jgi:hypothetical protein